MTTFLGYRCSICGVEYRPEEATYVCPNDSGNLDVVLDYQRLRDTLTTADVATKDVPSIWRYLPLLPVGNPGHEGTPLHAVGWSPLFRPTQLANQLSLHNLWLKDDGRNPTASFKDRASAVVVTRAQEIDASVVVTASTGNAGAALAGMAAAVSLPAVILAPKNAPPAKVAQLLIFGAQVFLIDGTYDDAFDLSLKASEAFGWYCRNTGYNPFTAEGKKTAAFEICEQMTRVVGAQAALSHGWESPDAVFVSVGDGNIISSLHKGFKDLIQLNWIQKMPRLFGIQSEGSAAIYNAFAAGVEDIRPVQANTIADSIAVDLPRDGLRAVRAATQTGGAYLTVSDREILKAMRDLGTQAAIFAEPAGATAYAGLIKAVAAGIVQPEDYIVVLNTGNGLKDVGAAMDAVGEAMIIEPTMKALEHAIQSAKS